MSNMYRNAIAEMKYLANPDPSLCRCGGSGWMLSAFDTWETCPVHTNRGPHPEYDIETPTQMSREDARKVYVDHAKDLNDHDRAVFREIVRKRVERMDVENSGTNKQYPTGLIFWGAVADMISDELHEYRAHLHILNIPKDPWD